MVDWPQYLAPWVNDIQPGSAQDLMYVVGAVEIVAGLAVLLTPWVAGHVVAACLGGIGGNLLPYAPPKVLRHSTSVGLLLAALALARLALAFRASSFNRGVTVPTKPVRRGT